jgi:hypothetical protein
VGGLELIVGWWLCVIDLMSASDHVWFGDLNLDAVVFIEVSSGRRIVGNFVKGCRVDNALS